jgi:hypothetical protein
MRPPNNFDLTDYITIYCILGPQSEALEEEDEEEEQGQSTAVTSEDEE